MDALEKRYFIGKDRLIHGSHADFLRLCQRKRTPVDSKLEQFKTRQRESRRWVADQEIVAKTSSSVSFVFREQKLIYRQRGQTTHCLEDLGKARHPGKTRVADLLYLNACGEQYNLIPVIEGYPGDFVHWEFLKNIDANEVRLATQKATKKVARAAPENPLLSAVICGRNGVAILTRNMVAYRHITD